MYPVCSVLAAAGELPAAAPAASETADKPRPPATHLQAASPAKAPKQATHPAAAAMRPAAARRRILGVSPGALLALLALLAVLAAGLLASYDPASGRLSAGTMAARACHASGIVQQQGAVAGAAARHSAHAAAPWAADFGSRAPAYARQVGEDTWRSLGAAAAAAKQGINAVPAAAGDLWQIGVAGARADVQLVAAAGRRVVSGLADSAAAVAAATAREARAAVAGPSSWAVNHGRCGSCCHVALACCLLCSCIFHHCHASTAIVMQVLRVSCKS